MTPKTIYSCAICVAASLTGLMSICLLTLPYYLFPQFYSPKANAAWGYTAPASAEGWAFLATGFLLLCITVVLFIWLKARQKP